MQTRIKDLPAGFSFQYVAERKGKGEWRHVNGAAAPAAWPTAAQRDRARACFTHRRSVPAALGDLFRTGLWPLTKEMK